MWRWKKRMRRWSSNALRAGGPFTYFVVRTMDALERLAAGLESGSTAVVATSAGATMVRSSTSRLPRTQHLRKLLAVHRRAPCAVVVPTLGCRASQ